MYIEIDGKIIETLEEAQEILITSKSVKVGYCDELTELHCPAAKSVDVWCCPALTVLQCPAAETVEVGRCAALTELQP